MELHVLGAGCDVGRSCILLTISDKKLLLDCGAHPGFSDNRRFPDFSSIPETVLNSLDAILISHSHFDHAGALPFLTETLKSPAKVYMNEPTKELAKLMLKDLVNTSIARGDFCPFDLEDVEKCIAKVSVLEEQMTIGKENDIQIRTYNAGHMLGAVMIYVSCGGRSVFFSGDYNIESDGFLKAADIPIGLRPDVFITEATYCSNVRPYNRLETEGELVSAVRRTLLNNGKVLFAVTAFGRVHTICKALQGRIPDVPVYVTSGLASRVMQACEKYQPWMDNECFQCADAQWNKYRKSRFADECKHRLVEQVEEFHRSEHWQQLFSRKPKILMATPGNVSTGVSKDVLGIWGKDSRNLLVVTGFNFGNIVQRGEEINCRVLNLTCPLHADAAGIEGTCRKIDGQNVVLVHGEGRKLRQFRGELEMKLGVPCFAPENGEKLVIPDAKEAEIEVQDASSEWKDMLKEYQGMIRDWKKEPDYQSRFQSVDDSMMETT